MLFGAASLALSGIARPALGQAVASDEPEKVKPVSLRVGIPSKQNDREVVFPLIVEISGAASVGRIRAELELSRLEGWSFRGIELSRGINLRNSVRKRNEDGKLLLDWDISAEGKELPAGHVAVLRMQSDRGKSKAGLPASDNPPILKVRKMSWGLAEFEKIPEDFPQINTPDNLTGNPDVSCFFFTH